MNWQTPFLIISLGIFSPFTFSVTLGEGVAAAGIQNTLHSGAVSSSQKMIHESVKQVKKQKQERDKKVNFPKEHVVSSPKSSSHPNHKDTLLESLSRDELNERFNDGGIEITADKVDYTKGTTIFYKDNCKMGKKRNRSPSSTCNPIPVLTNIKSVIFNYAHNRGEFKEKN